MLRHLLADSVVRSAGASRATLLVPVDASVTAERVLDAALRVCAPPTPSLILVGLLPLVPPCRTLDLDDVRAALTAAEYGFGPWPLGLAPLPGVEEQALFAAVRRLRQRAMRAGVSPGLRVVRGPRLSEGVRRLARSLCHDVTLVLASPDRGASPLHDLAADLIGDPRLRILLTEPVPAPRTGRSAAGHAAGSALNQLAASTLRWRPPSRRFLGTGRRL
jgi:hypothetical protein